MGSLYEEYPGLSRPRLEELLGRIPDLRVAVVGDFFLDKYMVVEAALTERSLETGLEARQVVEIRCSPGAAGTVMNNLSALGVGRLEAVGVIGDDGEGYELLRGIRRARAGTDGLVQVPNRFTPTYTKPMLRKDGQEQEMERLDIKNRTELEPQLEDAVLAYVERLVEMEGFHAVMIADQVQEANCGVITDRVRARLQSLATRNAGTLFFADSRVRIGLFRDVIVKPNRLEAAETMGRRSDQLPSLNETAEFGMRLAKRNGRPVFITLGEEGIMACTDGRAWHVAALPVRGPIDIVGAGDSASAGIVCALCGGGSLKEAASLGNLCANVTIHKVGTTGTASPDELISLLA